MAGKKVNILAVSGAHSYDTINNKSINNNNKKKNSSNNNNNVLNNKVLSVN